MHYEPVETCFERSRNVPGCLTDNPFEAENILLAQERGVKRSFLFAVGAIIGVFFVALAVTGIFLLLSEPFLSKYYTTTVTVLSLLLAYGGFRVAVDALHTNHNAN